MAFAGGAACGSSGHGLRERGRAAAITRSRRGPSSSSASTTSKAEGRRTPTRLRLDRSGMAADEPPVIIDLTSSGDELHSAVVAGRGQVTEQRGDGATAGTSQQSLPNTPRRRRPLRAENPPDSTPNFRSAAAMAGWDDETLLMLAVGQESPAAPSPRLIQAPWLGSPEAGPSRAASCPDACAGCLQCRERKRGTRTPSQAATPLSAARRRRRARRISSNEETLEPIPMAVFNDGGDKCGAPARKSEGCSKQQPSDDKENKNLQSCSKSKSVNNAHTSQGDAVQLDQLREELTCVVCFDICFEPSTTSCGHSFCRGCLQSVYQKCGMRCPKCRQELRATSKNDCPINTVLWNTIQLLFPEETAARLKDQKKSSEKCTKHAELQQRANVQARSISRPTPWRRATIGAGLERTVGNVYFSGTNLTSFRRASEVLELGRTLTGLADGYQQMRGRRPAGSSTTSTRAPQLLRQEEVDAVLAARLQESFLLEVGL